MNGPLSSNLLIVEMGERLSAAACGSLLAELGDRRPGRTGQPNPPSVGKEPAPRDDGRGQVKRGPRHQRYR